MATRLPLAAHTHYVELLEQLTQDAARARVGGDSESGSYVTKEIRGRRYWYLQRREGGTQHQTYLGADTEAVRALVAQGKAVRAAADDRVRISAMAAAGGAFVAPAVVLRVLQLLARANVFRLGGVLVGSHALGVIGNMLGVRWSAAAVRTRDLDVAHDPAVALALSAKVGAVDLVASIESQPGGMETWAIPGLHAKSPSTSFQIVGTELHVDLLTPARGRETGAPRRIAALNAAAQPLRFLDYLIADAEPAAVVGGAGILVHVPVPARFALHKLIVSQRRTAALAAKSAKDLAQAAELIDVLLDDRPRDLTRAFRDLTRRGAGWTRPAQRGLHRLPPAMIERLAAVGVR